MKKYVLKKTLSFIKKYKSFTPEQEEIVVYGLEGLYILLTKSIGIFTLAYILGILKETLIFTLIYNLIRTPSFGLHAKESWMCWISSSIIFLGIPYIANNVSVDIVMRSLMGCMCILYIYKYAPADTHKKPIVNPKRRFAYKTLSSLIAIAMVTLSLILNNVFIQNCLIFALIVQCFMISPQIYKIFKLPYDNYKYYQEA